MLTFWKSKYLAYSALAWCRIIAAARVFIIHITRSLTSHLTILGGVDFIGVPWLTLFPRLEQLPIILRSRRLSRCLIILLLISIIRRTGALITLLFLFIWQSRSLTFLSHQQTTARLLLVSIEKCSTGIYDCLLRIDEDVTSAVEAMIIVCVVFAVSALVLLCAVENDLIRPGQ